MTYREIGVWPTSKARLTSIKMENQNSRRAFIKQAGGLMAGGALVGGHQPADTPETAAEQSTTKEIPQRDFGRTGVKVSAIGVGGFDIAKNRVENEAIRIIHAAIDAGVNFFDNAWEYHDGISEEWMGKALVGKREKIFLMTKVCTHGRDRRVAMQMLEDSLRRLKTDHLDLWQVHEVIYPNDPEKHFEKGGVIEAIDQAKREGKVRFVGFTGHKDPSIHLDMLKRDYPFDACMLPLNCFDASFRSFEQQVLPELNRRGIAAIGMKSLGGGGDAVKAGVVTPEESLRYAMSLPVATTVSGMPTLGILEQNLSVAQGFTPMAADQMRALRDRLAPLAADGRFELYKSSKKYDGDPGRKEHGFPPQDKLST